jgi:CheY-like chemotaxis protein/anti-sigma regulatory factor (Ser/Thr protein kinase)
MLQEGFLSGDKAAKAVATIERSARALTQLIDDLLDVSRIIAGKMRLEVRPTDLTAVIQSSLDVVRPAADAKRIRLQATLDTETGTILGDPDRLQQVVWNLLSNAIKFTPRDGRVHIVLERVDSHVEITVSDTGQGFDPTFRPYLFDRFRQADSAITRTHGGLGLGLAIVRHIVELHGGTVQAESAGEQKGATFTVNLPRGIFQRDAEGTRRHPTAAESELGPAQISLKSLRVLVVDDEPDSNEVVSAILTVRGAEVRVGAGVAQALEVMRDWVPDLVVTDIGMPGQDGYSLLAAMRRDAKLSRVPGIALTAYASRDDRIRILAAGFQLHLAKPVDPTELVASVANVAMVLGKL